MASLPARIVGFVLRKTGYFKKNFSGGPAMHSIIAAARAAPPDAPSAKMRARLDIKHDIFDGQSVWHIAPKGHDRPQRLIYFHGGGYVYSAAKPHWDFLCHMADKHGVSIIAPLYPLAPEADAVATTDFALAFYRHLLTTHAAADLAVAGDSAGGGLAVSTMMAARDAGLPLPAKAVLICPWLEADPAHPDQVIIESRDAILTRRGIADAGKLFARDLPLTDPRVSPLHGNWDGLPHILMFGGGDDILVTDARALKAKQPGVDYHEEAGNMHVWPIFVFPESRRAQAHIARFLG
jgi:epsilon-lactone hydrolase